MSEPERNDKPSIPPPPLDGYVATLERIAEIAAGVTTDPELRTRLLQFANQLERAFLRQADRTTAALGGNWLDTQDGLDALHADLAYLAEHVALLARELNTVSAQSTMTLKLLAVIGERYFPDALREQEAG